MIDRLDEAEAAMTRTAGRTRTGGSRGCGVLTETGLGGHDQMNAVQLLSGHIRNAQTGGALGSFPWNIGQELNPAMASLLRQHRDRYPAVTAATVNPGEGDARSFGLQRILDGLDVFITAHAPARRPRSGRSSRTGAR